MAPKKKAVKKGTGLEDWVPKEIGIPAREESERQPRADSDHKSMTFRLSKPAWARLGKFAIDLDKRVQGIVEHGLNLCFLEMGLPVLIEDDPLLARTLETRKKAREVPKAPTPVSIVEEPQPREPQQVDGHELQEQQAEAV